MVDDALHLNGENIELFIEFLRVLVGRIRVFPELFPEPLFFGAVRLEVLPN